MKNNMLESGAGRIKKNLKKNLLLVAIAFVVLCSTFAGFYFASSKSSTKAPKNTCSADACLALTGQYTVPQVLTVKSGSYVLFNSADNKKHNIELVHSAVQHDDANRYESGDFGAGESWKVQFKEDGAYTFADKYDSKLEVNVIVYTEGKEYKIKQ